MPNSSACYIEYNDHETLESIKPLKGSIFYQDAKKIAYQGIDMFFMPKSIADIQKYEYEFYIYDFGNIDNLSTDIKNNFMSRDLKIIVSGKKPWEEQGLIQALVEMGADNNSYIMLNFIDESRRNDVKQELRE